MIRPGEEPRRRRHPGHRLPGTGLDGVGVGQGARHAGGHLGGVRVHRAGQRQRGRARVRALSAQPGRGDRAGPGARTDVCGRVVLSHRRRPGVSRTRAGHRSRVVARRVAVTAVAAALIVVAESAAVLSASVGHRPDGHRHRTPREGPVFVAYGGEPHLPSGSRSAAGPWTAAVRFVRDYDRWSDGHLAAVPAQDATPRVIRLLERQVRATGAGPRARAGPVRIEPAGAHVYVVTSRVGNFLVGRRGGRWLVVSLPGD